MSRFVKLVCAKTFFYHGARIIFVLYTSIYIYRVERSTDLTNHSKLESIKNTSSVVDVFSSRFINSCVAFLFLLSVPRYVRFGRSGLTGRTGPTKLAC